MIKAAIFDLDGTIADTLDDITDGINGMLCEYSFPILTRSDTLKNINYGAFELVKRSLPEKYRDNKDFIINALKVYEKYYAECYDNKTCVYQGIPQALKELSKAKIKLAILSNKQDLFVKNIISKLFPENLFDLVLGQGRFPPKPSSDAPLFICNELDSKPSETAFVGDSHVDMLTAKAASLHPVGVTWGYRSREVLIENGAEILISSPHELIKLLSI